MTKANISGSFQLLEQKAKRKTARKKIIIPMELQITSGTYLQILAT